MRKLRNLFILILAFSFLPNVMPYRVYAGDGIYADGDPDKLTLTVLFQFDNQDNFDPNTAWESAFSRASELLYNATDGQLQIGEIIFYQNCPEMRDKADILIQSGSGDARAHVEGLGNNGAHVFLFNDRHSQNLDSGRGHFGIVHEFGHYVFGLYDSYKDKDNNSYHLFQLT